MKRHKLEFQLIAELMRNSRQSDRELAKKIGVSQPTITRERTRLEKEGYIKEYTMIPDFYKLGFEIMAIGFYENPKYFLREKVGEAKRTITELEKENPIPALIAAHGMGLGYNRVFISFHENYSSFVRAMDLAKQIPNADTSRAGNFVISLADKEHHHPLTFSIIAQYLSTKKRE
jgi:DNA-binding Lrp family transcriptional regulator